jgi:uncharacterized protein YigE (DUF2233 family)
MKNTLVGVFSIILFPLALVSAFMLFKTENKPELNRIKSLTNNRKINNDQVYGQTLSGEIVSYTINLKEHNFRMYWKNENDEIIRSIQNLKDYLFRRNEELVFAMNGGMYMENRHPLGLFIEDGVVKRKLNEAKGTGNFYLMPNGVFYIRSNGEGYICKTSDFALNETIVYATQSGPMLVVEGKINSAFTKGSSNVNIRNGVGILPDNKIIFAISKSEVNLYDFAEFFLSKGCKNALYLDGYISKMYCPENNMTSLDGDFGVILGVSKKK